MFPSSDMNFDKGRFLQPSNNAGAQSLFQRNDPFAQNIPGVNGEASPAGVSSVLDVAMAQAGQPTAPLVDPVGQAPVLSTARDLRDDPSTVQGSFGPSGANAALVKPVTALDIMENPIGAAAQWGIQGRRLEIPSFRLPIMFR